METNIYCGKWEDFRMLNIEQNRNHTKKMICGRMHGSANRWSMMCCREKMVETHPKQNVT